MTAVFFSDVHLQDSTSERSQLVLKFIREAGSRADHIYILGDLFDVWPGTNSFLVKRFGAVLDLLSGLIAEGRRVTYVEGNHDFRLGRHFQKMGIEVCPNEKIATFNDTVVYMAHGDLGNPNEKGYRALRRVLRSSLLHGFMRVVPGKFIFQAGLRSSQMSRAYQKQLPSKEEAIRETYRKTAMRLFENGMDIVLMGHTHLPDDFRQMVQGRSCRYINTGDWVRHFTYLEFDGRDFYTKSYPAKSI